MVCDAADELPQASVASHDLVTVYSPAQSPGIVTSDETKVNALPQRSDAVATANCGTAGQAIVSGGGKAAITGAVVS